VGIDNLITVDIGGTSCDIALITGGDPLIRADGVIDRYPVRVGMVDVNAIGSGGGSIAWLDAAGVLRVGPRSAGSEPGPACYGRGADEATVTDASVVLGYLNPEYFAGGALRLDPALAHEAVRTRIAAPMGITTEEAALGIHRVVNAQMAEGIRLMSINRGVDPREYALVALGGAGPLHACALAHDLYIRRVVIPSRPGVLSAIGLLAAPVEHEVSLAFGRALEGLDPSGVIARLEALDAQCAKLMRADDVAPEEVRVQYSADVCFIGQSYYLEVRIDESDPATMLDKLYRDFLTAHERVYGHAAPGPARVVNLRAVQRARGGVELAEGTATAADDEHRTTRRVLLPGSAGHVEAAVHNRDALAVDAQIDGPAIIEQADTTTLVLPGWRARRTGTGDIVMSHEAP
jgi:N-methylhydantoinase A/oxoprolinase/acetone carboxylase beta subunit